MTYYLIQIYSNHTGCITHKKYLFFIYNLNIPWYLIFLLVIKQNFQRQISTSSTLLEMDAIQKLVCNSTLFPLVLGSRNLWVQIRHQYWDSMSLILVHSMLYLCYLSFFFCHIQHPVLWGIQTEPCQYSGIPIFTWEAPEMLQKHAVPSQSISTEMSRGKVQFLAFVNHMMIHIHLKNKNLLYRCQEHP